MNRKLAFVLSGGGSRGALQVGALRALFEANIIPDMMVGTSVGAVNAAFLSIYGFNNRSLNQLEVAWADAKKSDLLPSNYLWRVIRLIMKQPSSDIVHRMYDFYSKHGLCEDQKFSSINDMELYMVATELNSAKCIIFGENPDQTILEGLLASTALPPWVMPYNSNGLYLMDGGAISPLPIEPAIQVGANSIIALDVTDDRTVNTDTGGFGTFLSKLLLTVELRQIDLELRLASAKDIPVYHLRLRPPEPIPIWDFNLTEDLINIGYQLTFNVIQQGYIARFLKDENKILGYIKKIFWH